MYNICEKTTEAVKTYRNLNEILALLQNVLWGKPNEAEKEATEELTRNPEIKQICQELTDYAYLRERCSHYEEFDTSAAFRKFRKQIRLQYSKTKVIYNILKYAAIFLLPLTAGIWLWQTEKQNSPDSTSRIEAAYGLPGKSSAMLKLASGEIIDISDRSVHIEDHRVLVTTACDSTTYPVTSRDSWNELTIPRGGEYQLMLEDGTKIWLNSDSKLRFPASFGNDIREVYAEGEIYFEVKHNPAKRFVIHTGAGDVNVYGTSFCIRAYQNNTPTIITLVEGSVGFISSVTRQQVKIVPGEQITANLSGQVLVNEVNTKEWISWKDGLFIFKNKNLRYIMTELSRWYDVDVCFSESDLENLTFTGILSRYENIDTFMEILETTQDIHYRYDKGGIVIFR